MFSRRDLLAMSAAGVAMAGSAAQAATFGNPDEPPQGAVNAKTPGSLTDPGPQNPALARQFPSALSPPATDVGGLPMDWASFNNAPQAHPEWRLGPSGHTRRFRDLEGDLRRQHAAVGRRHPRAALAPGGRMGHHDLRHLPDHRSRTQGRPYVADVKAGDLWYFPAGAPHSLQGLGPDGCEFVICFDDGHANEFNTLLVTDWFAHTPPEVLAKNFGVPAEAFAKIPLHDLWIFQGTVPGDLAADRAAVARNAEAPPTRLSIRSAARRRRSRTPAAPPRRRQHQLQGRHERRGGAGDDAARRHQGDALASERGRMAILHQGQRANDGVQYRPQRVDDGFSAGDIGYVPRNLGHYIENVGDTDLQFVGVFRASRYEEVSLSNWLAHTPPKLVAQHFNVDEKVIAQWPSNSPGVMPKS